MEDVCWGEGMGCFVFKSVEGTRKEKLTAAERAGDPVRRDWPKNPQNVFIP
jgi:hypothetical protein